MGLEAHTREHEAQALDPPEGVREGHLLSGADEQRVRPLRIGQGEAVTSGQGQAPARVVREQELLVPSAPGGHDPPPAALGGLATIQGGAVHEPAHEAWAQVQHDGDVLRDACPHRAGLAGVQLAALPRA